MKVEIRESSEDGILSFDGLKLTQDEQDTMYKCLSRSTNIYTATIDKKIICIWGVIPTTLLSDQGYIWMYVSEEIKNHEFVFIRWSQIALEKLLTQYNCLVGFTDIDAEDTKRWLRWLGAKFGHPTGKAIPFSIRKK